MSLSYGCTNCSKTTFRDEQNPNTPNLPFAQQQYQPYLSNVHTHADYPIFEQTSEQYVLSSIGNLNEKVYANTQTALGARDMVNTLASNLGTSGFPSGTSQADKNRLGYLGGLQLQLNNAFQDREGMRARIKANEMNKDKMMSDHADFNTKLQNLGNALQEAKSDREELHRKVDSHSHGDGINIGGGLGGIGMGALIALGLGAFLLTRGKK